MKPSDWAVILVSPIGEINVGGVARAMGNFGFRDFRIVAPRFDLKSLDCKRMSMSSYDIMESAKIFSTLEEAQADRTLSVAFSGRVAEDDRPRASLFSFVKDLPHVLHPQDRPALVFGREEWGLKLEELDQCDHVLEIPTTEARTSINLASAVSIVLSYLFYVEAGEIQKKSGREFVRPPKTHEEVFFKRIQCLVEQTTFTNPQNPLQNLEDLRAIYHRAQPSERDLRILFGILSGVEELVRAS